MSSTKVFLITGCSSGLGLSLTRTILRTSSTTGHKVIATSRNPSQTPSLVSEIHSQGGTWLLMDVSSTGLPSQVSAALQVHGRIDVLINNAGIGIGGAFEEQSMDDMRRLFDTNFFGSLQLIQLLLPSMRERRGGTIINVSSAGVYQSLPGISLYAASKWALDGFTASLAAEVACFGIKVILAIPGGMRTALLAPEKMAGNIAVPSDAYKGTPVEYVFKVLQDSHGKQTIDPEKAAERIVDAVDGVGMMEGRVEGLLRLPIGVETGTVMKAWGEGFLANVSKYEDVWRSCEFPDGQ
ncbi:putative short chain oxidoreductase/dehydrogenase [Rhizodiscina lignyota]|uniref:Short chain oxidoreductase/dehydrogenase n=1 Tax=Rhizodiscina lignyota TaxID=1504668 RepID=A0A9P4I783_9PEZI|nr:putative short chain oxidoreductase/dehydrogenase [Rhizodiscina lignyota]